MLTDRFRHDDTDEFLRLAAAEGWISDQKELKFLLSAFPKGCLVKRDGTIPGAFITSIRYESSGWIGNLLVHPKLRRQGIGAQLLRETLLTLEIAGAETVWLTASPAGKPLYEKLGFREIDRINRWIGDGYAITLPPEQRQMTAELRDLDTAGWGDRRDLLLTSLEMEGSLLATPDAFFISRMIGPLRQIGPLAGPPAATMALFEQCLSPSPAGEQICLDVPVKNSEMVQFLEQQGLTLSGSTVLMYTGLTPAYQPELIGACGSMGSMG
jgi:ribosomal protein S18 acetylase RimI-like enzyme